MIGIVVVSHSAPLAGAAVALAAGLLPNHGVPLHTAAGADGALGTDATAVAAAIEAADAGAGVLVLCDLGSAVLAAELALEFVDPDLATRTRLSPAPLIEGLVAAVATAAGGADLAAVDAAAEQALTPKRAHLAESGAHEESPGPLPGTTTEPEPHVADTIELVLPLGTTDGLHARPAAQLAALVASADAEVRVTNLRTPGPPADAESMLELMALDARHGDRVRIVATGPGAAAVLSDVLPLLASRADP